MPSNTIHAIKVSMVPEEREPRTEEGVLSAILVSTGVGGCCCTLDMSWRLWLTMAGETVVWIGSVAVKLCTLLDRSMESVVIVVDTLMVGVETVDVSRDDIGN